MKENCDLLMPGEGNWSIFLVLFVALITFETLHIFTKGKKNHTPKSEIKRESNRTSTSRQD